MLGGVLVFSGPLCYGLKKLFFKKKALVVVSYSMYIWGTYGRWVVQALDHTATVKRLYPRVIFTNTCQEPGQNIYDHRYPNTHQTYSLPVHYRVSEQPAWPLFLLSL